MDDQRGEPSIVLRRPGSRETPQAWVHVTMTDRGLRRKLTLENKAVGAVDALCSVQELRFEDIESAGPLLVATLLPRTGTGRDDLGMDPDAVLHYAVVDDDD